MYISSYFVKTLTNGARVCSDIYILQTYELSKSSLQCDHRSYGVIIGTARTRVGNPCAAQALVNAELKLHILAMS